MIQTPAEAARTRTHTRPRVPLNGRRKPFRWALSDLQARGRSPGGCGYGHMGTCRLTGGFSTSGCGQSGIGKARWSVSWHGRIIYPIHALGAFMLLFLVMLMAWVFVPDAKARHKPTVNQGALHIINPKQALLMTLPCPGMNLEQ